MKAKKHLGQNFLENKETLYKILESANITKNDHVIEIGPGHGVLSRELLQRAKKVTAIELDGDLIPTLKKKFPNLELLHQDALTVTPPSTPYKLVANIPYYITSPIINHFLRHQKQNHRPTQMTLLVQHEVAQKIYAKSGDLNVLAIDVQVFGKPKLVAKIPPSHFNPPPKVDSAIINIEVTAPLVEDAAIDKFFALIHKGFAHKRKKLSSNLGIREDVLKALGLSPNIRAQELSIGDWTHLYAVVYNTT